MLRLAGAAGLRGSAGIILPTGTYNTANVRVSFDGQKYFDPQFAERGVALNLTILVGTMTGTAEMVAQEAQTALEAAGHAATIRVMDDLDASVFSDGGVFLICTSTYGQGDVPDNAQEFFASLELDRPDLSAVTYGVFALGDITYRDTFCEGGIRFDALLTELGARRVGEIVKHDASSGTLPEEVAAQWIVQWAESLESSMPSSTNIATDGVPEP